MQDKSVWRADLGKPYGTTVFARHRCLCCAIIGAKSFSHAKCAAPSIANG